MTNLSNVTENLALNFCNSTIHRNGKIIELIENVSVLQRWSEVPLDNLKEYNRQLSIFNSLIDDGVSSLDELLAFRNELHDLLVTSVTNPNEIEHLTKEVELYLVNHPFSLIFVDEWQPLLVPVSSGLEGIKSLMYLSVVELFKTNQFSKLSCCANEKCPLLFINQSGRRKWCSMALCGNRNKVERFLQKESIKDLE